MVFSSRYQTVRRKYATTRCLLHAVPRPWLGGLGDAAENESTPAVTSAPSIREKFVGPSDVAPIRTCASRSGARKPNLAGLAQVTADQGVWTLFEAFCAQDDLLYRAFSPIAGRIGARHEVCLTAHVDPAICSIGRIERDGGVGEDDL